MTYEQPIFALRRAFATGPVATVFGTAGLLDLVPTLDPDIYEITVLRQDERERRKDERNPIQPSAFSLPPSEEVWGIASVYADRSWAIDSDSFNAGPGYIIV